MIKIEKEPDDLIKEFRMYEKCVFCHKETDTWNLETNTPVCTECAKAHSINDLDNDFVGFERSKNFSEESYLKAAGITCNRIGGTDFGMIKKPSVDEPKEIKCRR